MNNRRFLHVSNSLTRVIDSNQVLPSYGKVEAWRLYARHVRGTFSLKLQIWRPHPSDGSLFTLVYESKTFTEFGGSLVILPDQLGAAFFDAGDVIITVITMATCNVF